MFATVLQNQKQSIAKKQRLGFVPINTACFTYLVSLIFIHQLTKRMKIMNKDKILELLANGAYLHSLENRFYHPSFRKGYRAMHSNNISFIAAQRVLGSRLQLNTETMIYKLAD